ncbi:ABC transporter ATP-binding protein [Microbacterium sp. X-17]|uniref:ABC transporter ATP-binding protein n=1 Tax=Microbacterium sp. X-17 TaxID=3144404 RepID=UPI0031F4FED0
MTRLADGAVNVAVTPGLDDAPTPLVEVRDLSVHLPTGPRSEVHAVKHMELVVHPGERVGIVGESGSGKSITARAMSGLLPDNRRVRATGSVKLNGKEFIHASTDAWDHARRHDISMIFQDPLSFLNPTMSVGRQVREALPIKRGGASASTLRERVAHYMDMAGLPDAEGLYQAYPHELSGGMRQRVLIAMALAKEPKLIIADEPTTALDVTVQERVLNSLDHSVSQLGASLVMITHDLAVVARMCERIYVMRQGVLVETGTTAQVLTEPREPYTRELVAHVRRLSDDTPLRGSIEAMLYPASGLEEDAPSS